MNDHRPLTTSRLLMSNPVLIYMFYFTVIPIGILLLGGIDFFLIIFGLWIALYKPMIYWPRTRKWIFKLLGFENLPKPTEVNPSRLWWIIVNLFHFLVSLVFLVIGIKIVNLGVAMLLEDGFLNQNLIYFFLFAK